MPRSVKQWFWRIAIFLGVVVLGVFLYGAWYVNHYGFTHKWRTLLTAELRRRGFDFSAEGLTLSPFEGLVAEKANLYLLDAHHTHIMSIDRAAVDINFFKLIQKKPFLNSLDLRGTRLWVPVDMGENPPKLRMRNLRAKLLFLPGEVQIAQAEGELQGVQISVSGSLLHPESYTPGSGPPSTTEERERRREMARKIIAEIRRLRSDGPLPRIEARFNADLADLSGLRAEVQVRGDGVRRGKYVLETMRAQINYERGMLRLQNVQMSDKRGRLSASGEFTYAAPAGQAPAAHFQLDSTLDLPALAREFLPPDENVLTPFVFHDPPHLRIDDGRIRFAPPGVDPPHRPAPGSGPISATKTAPIAAVPVSTPAPTTPIVAIAPAAAPTVPAKGGFQMTGSLSLGRCSWRGLEFERVQTEYTCSNDRWYLRGLRLGRAGNSSQQITADVLVEPDACRVRLNSTMDPAVVTPLLPTRGRAMLGEWKFVDPPRVELKADGRSLSDPDGFRVEGKLNLGRTQYRGVGLNRLQSDFAYIDHALSYRHFTIERDEGTGKGDLFVYDFGKHESRLENIRATLDPGQVSVWIDPDVAHAVAPYRFRKPPATVTNGVVQFDGGRNSKLTVDFDATGGVDYTFLKRPLAFQSMSGQVLFTDDRLRLNALKGEIFGGEIRGSLDLSLVKGLPDYSAAIEVEKLAFSKLTKLFFDYETSKGELDGFYRFTGRGDDARTLHGVGQMRVEGANVFAIPFMGPLSGVLGQALPNFGMDVAHAASADFQTNAGKIHTSNINVRGTGFSLFGAGWLGYATDTMDMRVRINSRGLPGAVLYPVSKLLEYSSQGPLAKPVWRPRIFNVPLPGPATTPATEGSGKTPSSGSTKGKENAAGHS